MQNTSKKLALTGIISALYVALSLIVLPVSSSAIQVRISEGLSMLCLVFPQTSFALFVGCLIVNIICGQVIIEAVLGAVITFLSCLFMVAIGKLIKGKWVKFFLSGLFPILLNAFLLPLIWYYCYGRLEYLYIVQVALILAGQTIAVYGVGAIVYMASEKLNFSEKQ